MWIMPYMYEWKRIATLKTFPNYENWKTFIWEYAYVDHKNLYISSFINQGLTLSM